MLGFPDEEVYQAQGQWPLATWPLDANPKEGRGSLLSPVTLVNEAQAATSPPACVPLLQLFQGPILSRQWPI